MRRYNQAFQELYDSVITHHAHAANMRGEVTVSTWLRFNLCVYVFFNISYLAPAEVQGSTGPCHGADCTFFFLPFQMANKLDRSQPLYF